MHKLHNKNERQKILQANEKERKYDRVFKWDRVRNNSTLWHRYNECNWQVIIIIQRCISYSYIYTAEKSSLCACCRVVFNARGDWGEISENNLIIWLWDTVTDFTVIHTRVWQTHTHSHQVNCIIDCILTQTDTRNEQSTTITTNQYTEYLSVYRRIDLQHCCHLSYVLPN